MASVRFRNGKYYFRVTLYDKDIKACKWIERGPYKSKEEALAAANRTFPRKEGIEEFAKTFDEKIFELFLENHPAYIPLKTMYYTRCSVDEAYDMKIDDIDFENKRWLSYNLNDELLTILKMHIRKIFNARLAFLYQESPIYVNLYLQSGKRVNKSQIYYIRRKYRAHYER